MTDVFLGLAASLAVFAGAIQGIAWSWNRHVSAIVDAGLNVAEPDMFMSIGQVARRHSLGWTATLFALFLLLALSSFPAWQRLLIAAVLSVIYGLTGVDWGKAATRDPECGPIELFGRRRDVLWYRLLAVCECLGYLCALVLAAELAALAVT